MLSVISVLLAFAACANGAVSDAEKQEILDSHNEWRQKAGATAMLRMKWNDELAAYAERTVAKCSFDHTPRDQRQGLAGFGHVGENIYVNTAKPSFKEAVDSWGEEERDYSLDSDQCTPGAVCTHYTQINWAKTGEVGCAVSSHCSNVEGWDHPGYLIFCNYGVGGNMRGEKPFEKGTPGSKCQSEFNVPAGSDGLCGDGGSSPSQGNSKPDEDGNDSSSSDSQESQENNDNEDQGNGDNENRPESGNQSNSNEENSENTGASDECKDEIWYCHDWLASCDQEWTTRGCRKSCKHC